MRGMAAAALAACVVACSAPDSDATGETGAPDDAPDARAGTGAPDATAIVPTYYRDVAPVLDRHCAACHAEGGVAPFRLDDYDAVSLRAGLVAHVMRERIMPPWPADASGACGEHVDPRWVDDADIDVVTAWVEAGAVAGDPADRAPVEPPAPRELNVAVVLDPGEAYTPAGGADEYRCYPLDPGLDANGYITAFRVRPGDSGQLHHVQMWVADGVVAGDAAVGLDEADPGAGYSCLHGPGVASTYIGVWASGDDVTRYPDTTGIALSAGRRLIVQYHYHVTGAPEPDRSTVELEVADHVDHPLRVRWVRDTTFRLPPNTASVDVTGEGALLGSGEVARVWGARIHMHELGARGRLELDDGCLLDIPRWQVDWQLVYRFAEPRVATPQSTLRVTCTYDTRGVDHEVIWGADTGDEMCIGYAFVSDE